MSVSLSMDVKINSFITRKLATIGDTIPEVSPEYRPSAGILYEPTMPVKVPPLKG